MKCADIEKRLSAYIENDMPSHERALIEEHLKSCPHCSKSLADLRKAIERVKSVEELEPPPYLTQKIMAKVKEEAEQKKGILRWLLYPLHIKLPLEIAATVTIAITAVYIYHAGKPELKLAEAPMQDIAGQTLLKEKEDVQREVAEKDVAAPSSPPLAKESKKKIMAKPAVEEPQKSVPMKRPEVAKSKSLEMPPSPVHRDEKDKIGLSGVSLGKTALKQEALAPEANVQSFVAEKRKDVTVIILKVHDRESAKQEIEKVLSRLQAKIIKTEYPEDQTIISARLDAKKIKELIARLKQLGEIKEKEVSPEAYEGDREISIQIEMATKSRSCALLTELECIKSPDCTLTFVETNKYICRPATGKCEVGFVQWGDTQIQSCEAKPGCKYIPGSCYCPPDVDCRCGGGQPPKCVE